MKLLKSYMRIRNAMYFIGEKNANRLECRIDLVSWDFDLYDRLRDLVDCKRDQTQDLLDMIDQVYYERPMPEKWEVGFDKRCANKSKAQEMIYRYNNR